MHRERWCDGSSDRSFMVDPLSYFLFQLVLHDWCNKGRGMCYPVCVIVHIKEPLLLIDKSSLCGGSGFPLALNTFYLRLYGVKHMVKDHSDSEKGNPLPPHRLLLSINSKGYFICIIPHIQDNTYHGLCYTSRGALAGTRNSSMGPPHEGSIRRPIAP